ncbi:expressed unknown protein [Seminavis robusta]|uniref:Uncharacterized protein n=1 Tax=Seminavis robusta TaxID=568900 RepID=A0A9N8HGI6_9STRA|nr:expressed unknown protein [Seminavis robusta]|eukprot:Sro510_g157350.1 n/a (593) ;mRNA; f:58220-59998
MTAVAEGVAAARVSLNDRKSGPIFLASNITLDGIIPENYGCQNCSFEGALAENSSIKGACWDDDGWGGLLPFLLLSSVAVALGCMFFAKSPTKGARCKTPSSLCPIANAGIMKAHSKHGQAPLSLCPFASRGQRKPNRRTLLKKLPARPFASSTPSNDVSSTTSFWELYQKIANEYTGLFGDSLDAPDILAGAPLLRAIVNMAEHQSPQEYARCNADQYRAWMVEGLSSNRVSNLMAELESLRRSELKLVLGACVYLRHSWHQGDPTAGPVETTQPMDAHGNVVTEPSQLSIAVEFVAKRLGVAPFFNVYSWLFCNWRWTPSSAAVNEGLTFDKICNLQAGSMSPRFYWLTGTARESEANFWRAFAYSELMAIPMYGAIGNLMDQVKKHHQQHAPPTPAAIDRVVQSLQSIREATSNITAALVAYGTPELVDAQQFVQMQNTAHYAGTTAGASGFQAPCMVLLDTLLGVDYSAVSVELQETRHENIAEMLPEVVRILFGIVRPGARDLRQTFIPNIVCPEQRQRVQTAFNGVADELILWRSCHRSRAGKFIQASTVTTGRTNEDMSANVHSTFRKEMSSIIAATKATRLEIH